LFVSFFLFAPPLLCSFCFFFFSHFFFCSSFFSLSPSDVLFLFFPFACHCIYFDSLHVFQIGFVWVFLYSIFVKSFPTLFPLVFLFSHYLYFFRLVFLIFPPIFTLPRFPLLAFFSCLYAVLAGQLAPPPFPTSALERQAPQYLASPLFDHPFFLVSRGVFLPSFYRRL